MYHRFTGIDRKLKVLTDYYYKLTHLDFKALCPLLVTARIISLEDDRVIQHIVEPYKQALHVLEKISNSLKGGMDAKFDDFLSVLENYDDHFGLALARQIREGLFKEETGKSKIC